MTEEETRSVLDKLRTELDAKVRAGARGAAPVLVRAGIAMAGCSGAKVPKQEPPQADAGITDPQPDATATATETETVTKSLDIGPVPPYMAPCA